MKALLVADDEKAISNISEVLKIAGYDVITYKWLLKAMDNIEEITPHLIVISTKDYPRHWKTLAQYSSNIICDYTPEVILYADDDLDEDELKKAEMLNVRGIFNSIEVDGLDKLREIIAKKPDIFSGYLTEEEQGEVSLSDIIPDLKNISSDIASIKDELNKPFDIDSAIQDLKASKASSEEPVENSDIQNSESVEETDETQQILEEPVEDSEIQNSESIDETDETQQILEEEAERLSDYNETDEFASQIENEIIKEQNSVIETEDSNDTVNNFSIENFNIKEEEFEDDFDNDIYKNDFEETVESVIIKEENIDEEKSSTETTEEENQMAEEQSIEEKLAAIMNANKAEAKEKAEEAGAGSISCSFIFTNPITLALVSGVARNYNGMTLEFTPDIPSFIMNLAAGTQINCASLKIEHEISNVRAEVMSNDNNKLFLQIKK